LPEERTGVIVHTKLFVTAALMTGLFCEIPVMAMQAGSASAQPAEKGKKAESTAPATAQEIANAKSQGLVWVNLSTRVYHKDGEFYGKTKRGKFVTEDDAKKEGFSEAQTPATAKKTPKKHPDQSGLDASKETHSSTPPPAK